MDPRGDSDRARPRPGRDETLPHRRAYGSYPPASYSPPQYARYERLPLLHHGSEWPYRDVSGSNGARRDGYSAPADRQRSAIDPSPPPPPPPAPPLRPVGRPRTTPFLTEADREAIMERIRRGEKQADLAKEYNVSRAAITNLKQRRRMLEMLENSTDAKDRAEAQKRRRLAHGGASPPPPPAAPPLAPPLPSSSSSAVAAVAATTTAIRSSGGGSVDVDSDVPSVDDAETVDPRPLRPQNHREIRAPTTSRLLATLLDPTTPSAAFSAALQRHTRLLLEEAIGWSYAQAPAAYAPFAVAFGACDARRMLHEYSAMEPSTPTATLGVVHTRVVGGVDTEITLRVPTAAVDKAPVLVFLDASAGGAAAGQARGGGGGAEEEDEDEEEDAEEQEEQVDDNALQQCLLLLHALVFGGVPEHRLVLVVRVCDHRVAQRVARRFPSLQLVTARFVAERVAPEDRLALSAFRQRLAATAASDDGHHN